MLNVLINSELMCRNLLGEDIAQMNTNELQQIENQLETALKSIRSKKVTLFNFKFNYRLSELNFVICHC